jgi:NAD(P)-dependent dehydrogenase (short-subunit alcohol dehydrogenase family)
VEKGSPAAGLTVLVTGATGGIGLAAAGLLSRQGATVLVGGRDPGRTAAAVEAVAREGGRAEPFLADLAVLAEVRAAAARLLAVHPRIDVLVNNAAVVSWRRVVTVEGHERTWATNVLAPALLSRLLAPALLASPAPRIVNVVSEAHRRARMNWEDPELRRGYGPWRSYAQSKLALVLLTREQARREPGIAANAVHPGMIATPMWRIVPWPASLLLRRRLAPVEKGTEPIVRLATDPALEGVTGRYFFRWREAEPSVAARDDAAAARLWEFVEVAIS